MIPDGLLLVNKPSAVTSHTVVQQVKHGLGAVKAGHLGTLDPLATGVFPVCLGKATRLAPFYMKADKEYLASLRFGFFTKTDDREGEREGPFYKIRFTERDLEKSLSYFQGEYDQKPPFFSAKKIKGKKAYQLARKGVQPELPLQKVHIYKISLVKFEKDRATIFISCGSGTYVRSIARDLGTRLRCGAHVTELARTRFHHFELEQCCRPDDSIQEMQKSFIPISEMLSHVPRHTLDADEAKRVSSGSFVDVNESFQDEWVRLFNAKGQFLAMAQVEQNDKTRLQPRIVVG